MNNISTYLLVLGIISFLFPLIITAGYLLVRNKKIMQKLLFLTMGTFSCLGVKFFVSFFIGQVVRYFIKPQSPSISFAPLTIILTTFNLLLEITLYLIVLAFLEKKLYQEKTHQRKDSGKLLSRYPRASPWHFYRTSFA